MNGDENYEQGKAKKENMIAFNPPNWWISLKMYSQQMNPIEIEKKREKNCTLHTPHKLRQYLPNLRDAMTMLYMLVAFAAVAVPIAARSMFSSGIVLPDDSLLFKLERNLHGSAL